MAGRLTRTGIRLSEMAVAAEGFYTCYDCDSISKDGGASSLMGGSGTRVIGCASAVQSSQSNELDALAKDLAKTERNEIEKANKVATSVAEKEASATAGNWQASECSISMSLYEDPHQAWADVQEMYTAAGSVYGSNCSTCIQDPTSSTSSKKKAALNTVVV